MAAKRDKPYVMQYASLFIAVFKEQEEIHGKITKFCDFAVNPITDLHGCC
jgi:hypothetical protein